MMQALLINLALFCQANGALPPPPAPIVNNPVVAAPAAGIPGAETTEDLRNWLLARLVVDLAFDAQKSAEVKSLLGTMDDSQVRYLVAYYKERAAKKDQPAKPVAEPAKPATDSEQAQTFEQAVLNQQLAEAYRDHLKREYDRQILQGYMTQNLVYQNILNNQRMMYLNYGPYTSVAGLGYGPYGYGGFSGFGGYGGYGPMSPVAFGYGAPGMGTSMMYGNPYYGTGMGFY